MLRALLRFWQPFSKCDIDVTIMRKILTDFRYNLSNEGKQSHNWDSGSSSDNISWFWYGSDTHAPSEISCYCSCSWVSKKSVQLKVDREKEQNECRDVKSQQHVNPFSHVVCHKQQEISCYKLIYMQTKNITIIKNVVLSCQFFGW